MDLTRSNTFVKKVIFSISFIFLVNISYATAAASGDKDVIEAQEIKSAPLNPKLKSSLEPSTNADAKIGDALESASHIGVSNYLQMILGLFGVVAFIFAIAWLAKRMGALNASYSSSLKVVAALNVGHREKIIVVQVMDKQLLVGVTQTNIQLLSELDEPISESAPPSFGGFQEKLQAAIIGQKDKFQKGKSAVNKSSANDFRKDDDK